MNSLIKTGLGLAIASTFLTMGGKTLAATFNLDATLSGDQQVPPVNSTGSGSATMTLDTDTNLLSWNITFSDLLGTPTMAHFHGPAAPGANAGVQVDIAAISGLSSPLMGQVTVDNTQESDILKGLWYINIHTTTFPSGEIRGQVQIPEPTSVASIVGAGLLCLLPLKKKFSQKSRVMVKNI